MSNLIKIEDIENSPNKNLQIHFKDFIDGIKSNKPIKANLEFVSLGEFIKITGKIQGSALLDCDLCLNEFEYKLDFNVDEMFAKDTLIETYNEETEIKEGQFITDLKGKQEIDIIDFLYQSVILDFPNKKVCDIKCKGGAFLSEDEYSQNQSDPRMEVFKNININ